MTDLQYEKQWNQLLLTIQRIEGVDVYETRWFYYDDGKRIKRFSFRFKGNLYVKLFVYPNEQPRQFIQAMRARLPVIVRERIQAA